LFEICDEKIRIAQIEYKEVQLPAWNAYVTNIDFTWEEYTIIQTTADAKLLKSRELAYREYLQDLKPIEDDYIKNTKYEYQKILGQEQYCQKGE
jgi:hypothetical protein